jgi:hypothetical protein
MANVYIEARPKGRQESSPIDGYVVEDHVDGVLGGKGHHPLVARVRHLNSKKNPDHWRSA